MSFTLEAAELATLSTRLVALASIYADKDKHAAAEYLRRELNPDMEPQEIETLQAIIALLDPQ